MRRLSSPKGREESATLFYAATGTKIFGFHFVVMSCVLTRANTIGLPSLPYLSSKSRFNMRTSGSSSGKSTSSNFSGRTSSIFGLFSTYLMISPVRRTFLSTTLSLTFDLAILRISCDNHIAFQPHHPLQL